MRACPWSRPSRPPCPRTSPPRLSPPGLTPAAGSSALRTETPEVVEMV